MMEDMEDDVELLFIREDDREPNRSMGEQREHSTTQSGLSFTQTTLNPSALIGPYLQEMDDLLKSCEDLTGLPFTSRFSESQGTAEVTMKTYMASPRTCPSSSYIDTHVHEAGSQDYVEQLQSQSTGAVIHRRDVTRQTDMPLTSAGKKLSETMVEYEGQLLGMLAMLDSSVEETRMEFEPQDWTTDTSQEYVHICMNPHVQQESWENQEAQPMQLEHAEDDTVSKNGRGETSELLGCDKTSDSFKTDLDPCLLLSGHSKPLDNEENDPMCCEGTKTEYMFNVGTEMKVDKSGKPIPAPQDVKMDMSLLSSDVAELQGLATQMEECIEGVQLLQKKRKKLLAEVLELRGDTDRQAAEGSTEEVEETEEGINSKVSELMNILQKEEEARREERKREIQNLKDERAEEERRAWKVNLERQGLQDELRKMKRRLFNVARDCAHNQATLNNQHRSVTLLKTEEV